MARPWDQTHATNPLPVPPGSSDRNSSAMRRISANAASLPVSPSGSSPVSADSSTVRRSAIRSATALSLRPRAFSWAFTSARSSRPLPALVRNGTFAERRAASIGSVWAFVRTRMAWSDQRPSGPFRSRIRRTTPRASASWSSYCSTTGSGPGPRFESIGS